MRARVTASISEAQTETCTQALAAVRGLLDPTDERYEAQQGLAAAGALTALATLIGDANDAVGADAAATTQQLLRHSSVVTTRCSPSAGRNGLDRLPVQPDASGQTPAWQPHPRACTAVLLIFTEDRSIGSLAHCAAGLNSAGVATVRALRLADGPQPG